jgi:hypothetical protein
MPLDKFFLDFGRLYSVFGEQNEIYKVVCLYILMIFLSFQGTVIFKLYAAVVMYVCSQVIFFIVIQLCCYGKWTDVIAGNLKYGINFCFFLLSCEGGR